MVAIIAIKSRGRNNRYHDKKINLCTVIVSVLCIAKYTVTMTVTDDDGGVDNDSLTITVLDTPPVVTIFLSDRSYFVEEPLQLGASAIEPEGDAIVNWLWDFDDGTSATTPFSAFKKYSDNDTYTITLTVTDNEGGVGSDSIVVTTEHFAIIDVEMSPDNDGVIISYLSTGFPIEIQWTEDLVNPVWDRVNNPNPDVTVDGDTTRWIDRGTDPDMPGPPTSVNDRYYRIIISFGLA